MSHELMGTTKEERDELVFNYNKIIQTHEEKINGFKEEISEVNQKASKLAEENSEKLNRRSAVDKQINSIKGKALALIILGIVAMVAGIILGLIVNLFIGIGIAVVGLLGIVFGCIIRPRWKQFADEQAAAWKDLEEYDKIKAGYDKEIAKLNNKITDENKSIDVQKSKINEIREYERYEPFYIWEEKSSHGYVVIMATADVSVVSDEPTPPKKGKKYDDSSIIDGVEVYFNEMRYCFGKFQLFSRQRGCLGIAAVEEEGTQKLETCVGYTIVNYSYCSESAPVPFRKSSPSKFIWEHISVCKRGTQVYRNVYDNAKDFMEATSLTKDDVLKCLKS